MKLGIGITTFPWPAEQIGPVVSRIATAADEAGVDSLWVMDHFFQIRLTGLPPESPMPEAYATLAFLGGLTAGSSSARSSPRWPIAIPACWSRR